MNIVYMVNITFKGFFVQFWCLIVDKRGLFKLFLRFLCLFLYKYMS